MDRTLHLNLRFQDKGRHVCCAILRLRFLNRLVPVENLAQSMQITFDAGGKRVLLPMASVTDIPTIPGERFAKLQTSFYADPLNSVFKAMGVQWVGAFE